MKLFKMFIGLLKSIRDRADDFIHYEQPKPYEYEVGYKWIRERIKSRGFQWESANIFREVLNIYLDNVGHLNEVEELLFDYNYIRDLMDPTEDSNHEEFVLFIRFDKDCPGSTFTNYGNNLDAFINLRYNLHGPMTSIIVEVNKDSVSVTLHERDGVTV